MKLGRLNHIGVATPFVTHEERSDAANCAGVKEAAREGVGESLEEA